MEVTLNAHMAKHCPPQDRALCKADASVSTVEGCGLSLAFGGHRVLDNLSFCLPAGSVTLLRGENGSGKTTLLNIINGFIRPDKGVLHLNLHGHKTITNGNTTPEALARAGVGRLWQDIRLFPIMSVLDNVLAATPRFAHSNLLLNLAAWPVWRRAERVASESALHHLETVKMADRAQSSCNMLSTGQMKRVAIARLLQAEAELLLLDEPLAGLDRASADGLLALLSRLQAEHGKTMLIVEHRYELLLPVCNRSLLLLDGKLTIQGDPR